MWQLAPWDQGETDMCLGIGTLRVGNAPREYNHGVIPAQAGISVCKAKHGP